MGKINFKEQVEKYETKVTNLALRKAKEKVFITFNFSFMTNNNKFNFHNEEFKEEHKHILFHRLHELSKKDIVSLTAKTNKNYGLEKIDKKNLSSKDKLKNMQIDTVFSTSKRDDLSGDGYWIFRLCPNNNPFESRIVGKMIDDTFYVMFIDINHDLYAKRR